MNFKGCIDTTLRDGLASPLLYDSKKYSFSIEERKKIVESLVELGVRHFEFFSPVVGEEEERSFREIKKWVGNKKRGKKIYYLAHCRCCVEDIKAAIEAGCDGLNLYMGLSAKAQENYGKSFSEIVAIVEETIRKTREKYPKMWLRYSGEDAFRTPTKDLFYVYDKIAGFVNTVGMPDTTGMANPLMVAKMVKLMKKRYPRVNLECHFHNERGMALVNALWAIKAGAEYVDTSVWGMAERSGISSITGLLFNLYHLDKKLVADYELELCYPVNVLMASTLKMQVPYNEPVSLTNRTHVAGVHQKAVLSDKKNYEASSLEKFGVSREELLLGPLSGWNYIFYYLKEVENFLIDEAQAKEIVAKFKKRSGEMGPKCHPEKLLLEIVAEYGLSKVVVPEKYRERRMENLEKK